ncbi:MAG: hypothetical protein HQK79_22260 [Desulfobacterales bacterium]|nr:hypothetical protein [Desulfobacterales bacterium]MBF0398742.1 hypothetical protein [Desulfobacterales bacterium]
MRYLIETKCDGVAKKFNDVINQRDAATRWRNEKPSLEALLTIADKFNCSLDWLITGKEHEIFINDELNKEIKQVCLDIKEIMELNDEVIVLMLKNYLESLKIISRRNFINKPFSQK